MKSTLIACALVLTLVACGGDGNEAGQSNQTDQTPQAANPHAQVAEGEVTWTAPEGWETETPSSAMRKAQFRLPSPFEDGNDASVVVFYFAGAGGAVEANLQRWYGQFKQPDGKLSKDVARVINATYHGLKHTLVDLKGIYLHRDNMMGPVTEERADYRMLASVIETKSGPWFVKTLGPESVLDYWEKSFYEFVSSFEHE